MKAPLRPSTYNRPSRMEKGAALIIILAMVVLLLGILVAFLTRSGSNRDTSTSSASLTAVELLTSVAVNSVIGGLQQEIEDPARSVAYDPPNGGDTLYLPRTPADAVPQLNLPGLTIADLLPDPDTGAPSGLENLLQVSVNSAADTPTTTSSRNGRTISRERWNKPMLMQRTATDGSDDSPPANFPTPEWILVARDGTNPASLTEARWDADLTKRETVIGRYAFVVYNQGGLLDANVAGYPESADAPVTGTNITDPVRYKPSAGYADLTIPEIGLTQAQVDTLVEEWRNEATLAAPNPAEEYFKLNLRNQSGFLSTANTSAPGGATDRMFVGRRQLIDFFKDKLDLNNSPGLDALQYFTTFSRSLNRPTFYRMQGRDSALANYHADAPRINNFLTDRNALRNQILTDLTYPWVANDGPGNAAVGDEAIINPIIPSITMAGPGTRFDGTPFQAGDPILTKRFPLDLLLWITYKGPSATIPADDPLRAALAAEGITADFLAQGTAENIERAFGLRWTAGSGPGGLGGYWTYDVHSSANPIDILETVAAVPREPDFFEILKATVDVGTLGRAREGMVESHVNARAESFIDGIFRDTSVNNHIMQLGANMIDQVHPENYPTQIVLPEQPGSIRSRSFWGTVDLPYFYGFTHAHVLVAESPEPMPANAPLSDIVDGAINNFQISDQTGATILLKIPILWNPHAQKTPLPAGLSPTQFRICTTYSTIAEPEEIGQTAQSVGVPEYNGRDVRAQRDIITPGHIDADTYAENFEPRYLSESINKADTINDVEQLGLLRFSNADPSALIFDINAANPSQFRRPTPLMLAGTDINLRVTGDHKLANMDMDSLTGDGNYQTGIPEHTTGDRFLGVVIGRMPVRFNNADNTNSILKQNTWVSPAHHLTFSLEYSTGAGSWQPYKQITISQVNTGGNYGNITASAGGVANYTQIYFNPWSILPEGAPGSNDFDRMGLLRRMNRTPQTMEQRDDVRLFLDPRTNRLGFNGHNRIPGFFGDPSNGVWNSIRPGTALGDPDRITNSRFIKEGGASSKSSSYWDFQEGAVNDPRFNPFYDADGVSRRPMGGWAPDTTDQSATTTIGLPMAEGGESALGGNANRFNRPIILHRPFRSVAEIAHTFSDTPWRNMDLSSPESGFTGLMDVFTVSSSDLATDSLVAGKVDLNTRQTPVITALLAGAYRDALGTTADISANDARAMARALVARTSSTAPGRGPLWNLAHLVGRFDPDADIQGTIPSARPVRFDGFSSDLAAGTALNSPERNVQRLREAPIRVLGQSGQAGTWNLLVDIVVQAGRYPPAAANLNDFTVEAEQRLWLHLAIDRLTGKILDTAIEVVTE